MGSTTPWTTLTSEAPTTPRGSPTLSRVHRADRTLPVLQPAPLKYTEGRHLTQSGASSASHPCSSRQLHLGAVFSANAEAVFPFICYSAFSQGLGQGLRPGSPSVRAGHSWAWQGSPAASPVKTGQHSE
jgi:hypothetical protein